MTDEKLAHLCRLGMITVEMIHDPDFLDGIDGRERRDTITCLRILADAFVELCGRQGIKPKFRVPAGGGAA